MTPSSESLFFFFFFKFKKKKRPLPLWRPNVERLQRQYSELLRMLLDNADVEVDLCPL